MDLPLLALRLIVGALFIGHGSQKLFGVFGGRGIAGTGAFFEKVGLRPGRSHAALAGSAELGAGVLLALGLLMPLGAAAAIAVMTAAVIAVHAREGLWNSDGGFEYNLVLATVAFVLACIGPGSWSVGGAIGIDATGFGWGLAALGAGLLGGVGAILSGRLYEHRHAHHEPRAHPA
jgi:putative oxidoreductase